jgi:hypothetical protein
MTENERFGLVFVKTGSINSGTVLTILAELKLKQEWQNSPQGPGKQTAKTWFGLEK